MVEISRRRAGVRALAVVALLVAMAGCDWRGFGGGPARTGTNNGEQVLGVAEVPQLAEIWSSSTPGGRSQPAVALGSVYVGGDVLRVFRSGDGASCAGTPRTCEPTWTATIASDVTPTVADEVVYTVEGGQLAAYDALGEDGCGGTPTVCTPLWTATTGGDLGSPVVADGTLYVGSDRLYAFDAAGETGCGGVPRTCTPVWTSTGSVGASPAVAAGRVYVNDATTLSAFDAAGTTGCTTGMPRTCEPLWSYEKDDSFCSSSCRLVGPPAVADGRVHLLDTACCSGGISASRLLSFDAAGQLGCTGPPTTCAPTGTANLNSQVSFPKPGIAVAGGRVFTSDLGLTALDANDLTTLWKDVGGGSASNPSVANGVVYTVTARIVGSEAELVPTAFDAAGDVGCSGTPRRCAPLWTGTPGPRMGITTAASTPWQGPAIAGGQVYVRTDRLRVYGLPSA